MKDPRTSFLCSLLVVVTLGYSWFLVLASRAYTLYLSAADVTPPGMAKFFFLNYGLWIALAWVSLAGNIGWAFRQTAKRTGGTAYAEAGLFHLVWIVTCCVWHGVAVVRPLTTWAYILRSK